MSQPLTAILTYDQLSKEICDRYAYAQHCSQAEFLAARIIQSAFRGYSARKRFTFLDQQATVIQSHFRGYLARKFYSNLLESTVQEMYTYHYNKRARQIQGAYRGWRSRRLHFDYYKMRAWLRQIVLKNEELEQETWAYFFEERNRKLEEINDMAKKLCVFIAKKLHHLLRTHQKAGIYSHTKCSALTNVERLLASFTFVRFNRDTRQMMAAEKVKYVAAVDRLYERTQECKSKFARCEHHYRGRNVDVFEMEMLEREEQRRGGPVPMKFPAVPDRPYVKSMLATEKYCGDIIEMTREFEILSPGRDFSLNTKIVKRPERIEQFIEVLQNFCVLHNLIEK